MSVRVEELQAGLLRISGPVPAAATPQETPASLPQPDEPSTAAPEPAPPCQLVDHKARGYHLDAKVPPAQVVTAADFLDRHGFVIDTVTGVDWMAAGEMEVIYDYFHLTDPLHVVVRTRIPRDTPELPTISKIFPGANWHERETHDFLGIRFLGHPDLSPLLLPEDATYHPLRKDFTGAA